MSIAVIWKIIAESFQNAQRLPYLGHNFPNVVQSDSRIAQLLFGLRSDDEQNHERRERHRKVQCGKE